MTESDNFTVGIGNYQTALQIKDRVSFIARHALSAYQTSDVNKLEREMQDLKKLFIALDVVEKL